MDYILDGDWPRELIVLFSKNLFISIISKNRCQKLYQAEKVRLNKQMSPTRIEIIIGDPTSPPSPPHLKVVDLVGSKAAQVALDILNAPMHGVHMDVEVRHIRGGVGAFGARVGLGGGDVGGPVVTYITFYYYDFNIFKHL